MTSGVGELEAGAAVTVVTPPLGSELVGLFETRTAELVEDDLAVRALVLRSGGPGGVAVALVVCDLIYLQADVLDPARRLVEEGTGIPAANVLISCTHTHSGPATTRGPATSGGERRAPDPGYLDLVARRIADSVALAARRLRPARVAVGSAPVAGVCFNRRYVMADGTVQTNPGRGNPDVRRPAGPTDPAVTALCVEDLAGRPIALWASLALHYVGADHHDRAISPDYFGRFARLAARWLGPDVVGMLSNGASGDINNVDVLAGAVTEAGSARAELVARAVLAAAVQATAMAARSRSPRIGVVTVPFTARRYAVTGTDVQLARAILSAPEGRPAPPARFGFVRGRDIPAGLARRYARGVLDIAARPETADRDLTALAVGDLAVVGLPGEIFVELGLRMKADSPFPVTAVVGLTGDHLGYVPTAAAFDAGGYETWRTDVSWTARGTGEAMVDAVREPLRRLR